MKPVWRRRLRVYPLLIAVAMWGAWGIEVLGHRGWQNVWGHILWSDFITLYAAGLLDRLAPHQIYDLEAQARLQQALIAPTPLPGLNPFISPPYVAWACRLLTLLPLPIALGLWSALTLALTMHAARRWWHHLPASVRAALLSFPQFLIVLFSFFPFLAGWRVGQNHGLTFWLVTQVLMMEDKHPTAAALFAGMLLYKPQFALGFLILWLARRQVRALLAFGVVAGTWIGADIWLHGPARYVAYLEMLPIWLQLTRDPGFPAFALVTPYSLLTTLLPTALLPLGVALSGPWTAAGATALFAVVRCGKVHPTGTRILAVLFPLLASPYAQLHDLMIAIPALILWAAERPSPLLLPTAIGVYMGSLLLPLLGAAAGLALPALIPLGLLMAMASAGLLGQPTAPGPTRPLDNR